jgi:hypothetical protein
MSMEYAVMAETHEGKTMTLRRGFSSQDDAEDHPVQMALWRRVWVAPVPGTETPKPAPTAAARPVGLGCRRYRRRARQFPCLSGGCDRSR